MPETQAQVLAEELDEAPSTAIVAQVTTKADVTELRAAISAIHERFEQVDKRFDGMNQNVNQRFNDLNQSVAQMRSWLAGLYVFIALSFLEMIAKDLIFK